MSYFKNDDLRTVGFEYDAARTPDPVGPTATRLCATALASAWEMARAAELRMYARDRITDPVIDAVPDCDSEEAQDHLDHVLDHQGPGALVDHFYQALHLLAAVALSMFPRGYPGELGRALDEYVTLLHDDAPESELREARRYIFHAVRIHLDDLERAAAKEATPA